MSAKRWFDLCIVIGMAPFWIPILIVTACIVRVKLGSPMIFAQERPGMNGVIFKILKFRTMTDARDQDGCLLSDNDRLTDFGRFLRATSLDELPELVNVLRGEMSLVGPRPLRVQYLNLYSPFQGRRHEVLPGISGWAQIKGRNTLSWEEKFELDVWYVDHQSIKLDIAVLLGTIGKVIRRDGISAVGEATMPEFTGTKASDPGGS